MAETTLEVVQQYVRDSTGWDVSRIYKIDRLHPTSEDEFLRAYRQPDGSWSLASEASNHVEWSLQEALVHTHFDRFCAEAERDELAAQLKAIEVKRAKWRESKRKGRKLAQNPSRYDASQESIFGADHVVELTGGKSE